jgi:hypothetical protein
MDGENAPHTEELMMGIIHGEIPYVHEDAGEGAGEGAIEGAGREGAGEGEEEDISSFLNPFGDGMEIEMFDKGQTDNDDERQLRTNTDGDVYIYIEPLVIRREYAYMY